MIIIFRREENVSPVKVIWRTNGKELARPVRSAFLRLSCCRFGLGRLSACTVRGDGARKYSKLLHYSII